jgi:hypothetical protein
MVAPAADQLGIREWSRGSYATSARAIDRPGNSRGTGGGAWPWPTTAPAHKPARLLSGAHKVESNWYAVGVIVLSIVVDFSRGGR